MAVATYEPRPRLDGPSQALRFFTNRADEVKRFCEHLHCPSKPGQALLFCGDGGVGKSLLLRHLSRVCCRLFADWDWAGRRPEDYLAEEASGTTPVPQAFLDLRAPAHGGEDPREALAGLLRLRRSLRAWSLPLFEFASVCYLRATGRFDRSRLASMFPTEEVDLLGEIVDLAVEGSDRGSLGAAIHALVGKHATERLAVYLRRRRLSERTWTNILALDPERELYFELPRLFAADLNAVVETGPHPRRLVLFVDDLDALAAPSGDEIGERLHERDHWIRVLLNGLDRSRTLVVFSAREPPRWTDRPRDPVPGEALDIQRIDGFSGSTARLYLGRVAAGLEADSGREQPLAGGPLQDWLCEHAEAEAGLVHPLLLAMAADAVSAALERGVARDPAALHAELREARVDRGILECLLRYVDGSVRGAVVGLSACRVFDRELVRELGTALGFRCDNATYARVLRFSFVLPAGRRGERFRIHDLVRRLVVQAHPEEVREAHAALEARYRRQTGGEGAMEAIYHASRLDPRRAALEWTRLLDGRVEQGDYAGAREMLARRGDLLLDRDVAARGAVLASEARYYAAVAKYVHAHALCQESLRCLRAAVEGQPEDRVARVQWGALLVSMGELAFTRSHNAKSVALFRSAIEVCTAAGNVDPELKEVAARASLGIGEVFGERARAEGCVRAYREALASAGEGLRLLGDSPADPETRRLAVNLHNDRGYALGGLAEMDERRGDLAAAEAAYREAAAAYAAGLAVDPSDAAIRNNVAYNLVAGAAIACARGRHEEARGDCDGAIEIYDGVLNGAPEDTIVLANRARALLQRSLCHSATASGAQARDDDQREALSGARSALMHAPDDVWAINTCGLVCLAMAEALARANREADALGQVDEATRYWVSTLTAAPDDVEAATGLARADEMAASLLLRLGRRSEAYSRALRGSTLIAETLDADSDDRNCLLRSARLLLLRHELESAVDVRLWLRARVDEHLRIALRTGPADDETEAMLRNAAGDGR